MNSAYSNWSYLFSLTKILNFVTKFAQKGISTNGGQVESTFAHGYQRPGVTFTVFFRIAQYHYYFNVSSPKSRRANKIKIWLNMNVYRWSATIFCLIRRTWYDQKFDFCNILATISKGNLWPGNKRGVAFNTYLNYRNIASMGTTLI